MLLTQERNLNSIFERIVKDKNGELVRVRFIVVEIDGKFQGQIVSAEPLKKVEEVKKSAEKTLLLPLFSQHLISYEKFVEIYFSKISPYTTLEFFMSQPTRAPSA